MVIRLVTLSCVALSACAVTLKDDHFKSANCSGAGSTLTAIAGACTKNEVAGLPTSYVAYTGTSCKSGGLLSVYLKSDCTGFTVEKKKIPAGTPPKSCQAGSPPFGGSDSVSCTESDEIHTSAPGNCSDPKVYPPKPITHESNPCDDFCSNKCAFSPTAPIELEMIRMTPRNVSGIANKDTGNDAGDLFFTLLSATKASECSKPDPPPWAGCFLNGDNVFIKSKVSVDGNWGIYQECNPSKIALPAEEENSGSFACCGALSCSSTSKFGGKPHNSSKYCYCDRTNHTVGKSTVVAHFGASAGSKFMPKYLSQTAELVGGNWYSTPARGECKGDHTPGDASGCTWKVNEVVTTINQTCVKGNVYGAVEKNCPKIFESCPNAYNRTDACYSGVFFDAFLGNSTFGCEAMTRDQLLKPWTDSFNGGCTPIQI